MTHADNMFAYTVRPATRADSRFLFELAMDPRIRFNSTRQEEFTFEQHESWYADKLTHPETHRIWIMEVGVPVAQIRYGKVGGAILAAEVSISVVPHEWRRGHALTLFLETMPMAREWLKVDTIVALVLWRNYPSRRLFRKAGFRFVGVDCRTNKIHARYEIAR